ncbi:MAG: glycosyltransferase family 2 protein [Paludibacteraceae bacterium]|nr:glycosyltransferase family 2 protein [Paludibacteraceae bacterium]
MVTIIILNYKGWQDTIECLASLQKQTMQSFRVVVADNGSGDESLLRIGQWIEQEKLSGKIRLLPLKDNYGFAKGNNLAIASALDEDTDYFWCLNNDTVLEPECLERMVTFMDAHKDISAATPGIRLYGKKDYLWNAGGKLVFGGRRYYCPMQPVAKMGGREVIPITFITGCALFFRKELIAGRPLFTERFFFGEEDFNFSLRMQKEKRKMVCLMSAVMYHKVGGSQQEMVSYNKFFIYLLNRLIDLRTAYPAVLYALWLTGYIPFVAFRFLRGLNWTERRHFIRLLLREARTNDGVSKELFDKYIQYSFKYVA